MLHTEAPHYLSQLKILREWVKLPHLQEHSEFLPFCFLSRKELIMWQQLQNQIQQKANEIKKQKTDIALNSAVSPNLLIDIPRKSHRKNTQKWHQRVKDHSTWRKVFNTAVSHKQEKIHSSQNQHIICYKLPPIVCSFHRLYPLYNYMELLDIT